MEVKLNTHTLKLLAFYYESNNGQIETFEINQAPVTIDQEKFIIGYTTKLNGLRWGINITIENNTVELDTDAKSPIKTVDYILEEI